MNTLDPPPPPPPPLPLHLLPGGSGPGLCKVPLDYFIVLAISIKLNSMESEVQASEADALCLGCSMGSLEMYSGSVPGQHTFLSGASNLVRE